MRSLAIIAAVAVAGCAGTIEQNRARSARAAYVSPRTELALEHCLAGKLSWTGTPSIIHGENETELAFTSDYGTEPLITLRPLASGTKVEVRFRHGYVRKMRLGVEECVSGTAG